MNLTNKINAGLPPPKEIFSNKLARGVGLYLGAALTISNDVLPWLAFSAKKSGEFATYLGSKYPFPPDPINMFNTAWLQDVVVKGLELIHLPFTNEIDAMITVFGGVAGPILIGLAMTPDSILNKFSPSKLKKVFTKQKNKV